MQYEIFNISDYAAFETARHLFFLSSEIEVITSYCEGNVYIIQYKLTR